MEFSFFMLWMEQSVVIDFYKREGKSKNLSFSQSENWFAQSHHYHAPLF